MLRANRRLEHDLLESPLLLRGLARTHFGELDAMRKFKGNALPKGKAISAWRPTLSCDRSDKRHGESLGELPYLVM